MAVIAAAGVKEESGNRARRRGRQEAKSGSARVGSGGGDGERCGSQCWWGMRFGGGIVLLPKAGSCPRVSADATDGTRQLRRPDTTRTTAMLH